LSQNQTYKELGADYLTTKQQVKRKAYLLNELKKLETQIASQHALLLPKQAKTTKKNKGRFLLTPITKE